MSASVDVGMREARYVFGAQAVGARMKGEILSVDIENLVDIKGGFRGKNVSTRSSGSACGLVMHIPEKYIFFVDEDGFFSACGATRIFGDSGLGVLNDRAGNRWIERAKNGGKSSRQQ